LARQDPIWTEVQTKTTLLIRHHLIATSDAEPDDLFRQLLQICDYHLEVRPLSSGRSGEVTGEVGIFLFMWFRS
jgi:hypothetical protein